MDSILWNHFFISRVEIFCRFWYLKRFLLFLILLSHSERRLRWIEFYRDIALKGTQWNLIKRGRYTNTARMTPKRFTTFNYRPKADQKKFWVLALLFCFVLCRTLMHFDNLLMDTKYIWRLIQNRYRKQQVIMKPQIICLEDIRWRWRCNLHTKQL